MGAIIVTGIPGVGKTTVMEAAANAGKLRIAVYGSVMFEVAAERKLATSRDDMRRLPAATQKEIQREAARRIAAMGDVIVDTHCSIKTPSGFLPGLPAWVLDALQPRIILLVEAAPADIQRRRTGDATRKRDEDSVEAIAQHQEYNRRFAAAYATLTGATVATVVNEEGQVEATMRQVLAVLGVKAPALAKGA